MSSAAQEQGAFFAALLQRFCAIVGDGAGRATFHFAALQEGLHLGRDTIPDGLAHGVRDSLARLGLELLDLEEDAEVVHVRVVASPAAPPGNPASEGILLGLLEGVLRAHRGAVFEASAEHEPSCVHVRLRRRPS